MKLYTPAEASKILGITTRSVQRRCLKVNIPRKNNQYQISEEVLNEWKKEVEERRKQENEIRDSYTSKQKEEINVLVTKIADTTRHLNDVVKEVKELKYINENLKNVLLDTRKQLKESKKKENKQNEIISVLREELQQYEVTDNERIEVFTNEEYSLFEQRLREWYSLQKDIEHKEELFSSEKKSLSELLDHYKNQFEYQKEQSTRILEMHQKLIDTIEKQNKIMLQRNVIEASEKDIVDKDTWQRKK